MQLSWLRRWESIAVISLVAVLLILHLVTISQVGLIFDEPFYVTEGYVISEGVREPYAVTEGQREVSDIMSGEQLRLVVNPEHPPLGKLFIALGINLFGFELFGFRLFSVLFGVAAIVLFYFICRELTKNRYIPLLATFIFAFENDTFVMSSVAMLDVYGFTLMLAAFLLYLRNRYMLSGVVLALATLAKMTAGFGGAIILAHWLITRRTPKRDGIKFAVTAAVAFLMLMPLLDWATTGEFFSPFDRIEYMSDFHSEATFANLPHLASLASPPFEWITSPDTLDFWPDPHYQSGASWTLWALIIPVMGYMLYETVKKRWNSLCLFAVLWFGCTYLSWVAIYFITDRIMYRFYFYPTIGAVCLALAYIAYKLWSKASQSNDIKVRWAIRTPVIAWMIGHFAVFWIMTPIL